MSGFSVGGKIMNSGYHVTDPNGHVIDVGSRGAAEDYAQQQNKLLQQGGLSSAGGPSTTFGDLFKNCAFFVVGTIILVVAECLSIVNFIILHLVFH